MTKKADLDNSGKRFPNHSIWKKVCKLQKGAVSNNKITAITGHKSEQSIAQYADTDLEDQQKISLLISHNAAATQPTVPHSSPYMFSLHPFLPKWTSTIAAYLAAYLAGC